MNLKIKEWWYFIIKQQTEIPEQKAIAKYGIYRNTVQAFLDSGYKSCEVNIEDRSTLNVYNGLRLYIRRKSLNISVIQRNDKIFLERI